MIKRVHFYLGLYTFATLLLVLERYTNTKNILLQPNNFLSLHEFLQLTIITLLIVISFHFFFLYFLLNWSHKSIRLRHVLSVFFIIGVYFFAIGNSIHELGSYLSGAFCAATPLIHSFCSSSRFNGYYFGNFLYFIGYLFINATLSLMERSSNIATYSSKDILLTELLSILFAFCVILFAFTDDPFHTFIFSLTNALLLGVVLTTSKKSYRAMQFTLFSFSAFTLGALIAFSLMFFSI